MEKDMVVLFHKFQKKHMGEPFSYFFLIAHMPVRQFFPYQMRAIPEAQNKTSNRGFQYPHSLLNLTDYVIYSKTIPFPFFFPLGSFCLRFSFMLKNSRSNNGNKS